MKFKIGDHVIGNKKSIYAITKPGWRGEVTKVEGSYIYVKALPGNAGGINEYPVLSEFFDLVKYRGDHKIVVTTDGTTTTAYLYKGKSVIKSAEAKCSPSDEFKFETGAALAVDRLLGSDVEKPVAPKLFPLEGIKAGYLLEVKDDGDPVPYFMTVLPDYNGELACVSRKDDYWSLDCFDDCLRYADTTIMRVYGGANPADMLENSPADRELLWSRT